MRPRGALAVVLSAQFVIPLSIAGSAIALPQIGAELGAHPIGLPGVVNGFNLAFALCSVLWGVASDRIGHVRAFRIGVGLAALGAVLSASAASLLLLDLSRVIAGIGAAAVLTGAAPIINQLFTGSARSRAFALSGTINGLGLAAGPFLSGVLITIAGWRGIFAAHALVLVFALVAGLRIRSLGDGVSSGRHGGLLDFGALRSRRFVAMIIVPVAGAIGFVALLTYLPSGLQAIHGLGPGTAGMLLLIMTVPVLVAPGLVHRLLAATSISTTAVVIVSLLCLLLGTAGMGLLRADLPLVVLIVPMILLGMGFGLPLGFVDAEALAAVPQERAGAAAGVLNLFRIGSEAVFVALFAAVVTVRVTAILPGPGGEAIAGGAGGQPEIYQQGWQWAIGISLVLLLACLAAFVAASIGAKGLSRAAARTR